MGYSSMLNCTQCNLALHFTVQGCLRWVAFSRSGGEWGYIVLLGINVKILTFDMHFASCFTFLNANRRTRAAL